MRTPTISHSSIIIPTIQARQKRWNPFRLPLPPVWRNSTLKALLHSPQPMSWSLKLSVKRKRHYLPWYLITIRALTFWYLSFTHSFFSSYSIPPTIFTAAACLSLFISWWTSLPMLACLMTLTRYFPLCVLARYLSVLYCRTWHSSKHCSRSSGKASWVTATSFCI